LNYKKIYYWSPSFVNIATNRAVINSAYSVSKYNHEFNSSIINFFGEFTKFKDELNEKNVDTIDFYNKNLIDIFPKYGKIKSRVSFFLIFILGFLPLKDLIKKDKPEYLLIHLITSLPLILLIFFKFKTKFILRISGLPKMNFFRKLLWKIACKKIFKVTCPTINTLLYIKSLKIIPDDKIELLYDPIIDVKKTNKKKKELTTIKYKEYFLAAGRLTRQKNFLFLCEGMKDLIRKDKKIKLLIAGEGEDREKIEQFIKFNNLKENIILLGHIKNIYPYFVNAKAFIMSSLWEDPGFVIVEAAFSRTLTLSNDSRPGPKELIEDDYNGIIFKKDNVESFQKSFSKIIELKNSKILKINNLKNIRKFTIFYHYKKFEKIFL
jgi:glycosyltransferase involved in cell wall biosynthesis